MTEYYIIKQSAVNPVKPVLIQPDAYTYRLTNETFLQFPESSSGYYEYTGESDLPGILTSPTFMVESTIKKVIEMYDETIIWKTLMILPDKMEQMNLASECYWIPKLKSFDCLDETSVVMPEGTIKRLVIREDKIGNADIFQIKNTVSNVIIVSLRLAESISRRNVYGVCFERVQVR